MDAVWVRAGTEARGELAGGGQRLAQAGGGAIKEGFGGGKRDARAMVEATGTKERLAKGK